MRRAAVTLAIVFATSTATGQTTGYKLARKPRMGLVYAGAGMLAGGFIASFITAIAYSFRVYRPSCSCRSRGRSSALVGTWPTKTTARST
jgi:hypothetical protein